MIDTAHPPRDADGAVRRTTSVSSWAIVLAAAAALLALRIPRFTEVARTAVAAEADALGDPELAGAAVAIGTAGAIALHVLALVLLACVGSVLERLLGPTAIGGRLRLGVAGATYSALVLGQQVAALVTGVASIERSWPLWAIAAAVGLAAPALFRDARTSARAYGRGAIASVATGALLCLG